MTLAQDFDDRPKMKHSSTHLGRAKPVAVPRFAKRGLALGNAASNSGTAEMGAYLSGILEESPSAIADTFSDSADWLFSSLYNRTSEEFLVRCRAERGSTVEDRVISVVATDVGWLISSTWSDPPVGRGRALLSGYEVYSSPNWDGFGAEAITPHTQRAAQELIDALPADLESPEVAPGSDGGIGLEWIWHSGPVHKLFIDIGPGLTWSAYWRLFSGEKGRRNRQVIDYATASVLRILLKDLGVTNGVVGR